MREWIACIGISCGVKTNRLNEFVNKLLALIDTSTKLSVNPDEIRKQEKEMIISFMMRQGSVFVDKSYEVIEAIRKGEHWQAPRGE